MAIPTIEKDDRVTKRAEEIQPMQAPVQEPVEQPQENTQNTNTKPKINEVVTLGSGEQTGLTQAGSEIRANAQANAGLTQPKVNPNAMEWFQTMEDPMVEEEEQETEPHPSEILYQKEDKPLPGFAKDVKALSSAWKVEPIKAEQPKAEKTQEEIESQKLSNKSSEIAVKGQEDALAVQKKQEAITEFQNMLTAGASKEELASFARENSQFSQSLNNVLKTQIKNKANLDFYTANVGKSPEAMYADYKAGNIVPWSNRYKTLPETQRIAFESYKKSQEAVNIIPDSKDTAPNYETDPQYTVDFTDLEEVKAGMFASTLREESAKLLNNPRKRELEDKLSEKATELNKIDLKLLTLQEDMENQFEGRGARTEMREYTRKQRELTLEKVVLNAEYGNIQASLQSIKDDIETELEFVEHEDEMNRKEYALKYQEYKDKMASISEAQSAQSERDWEIYKMEFEQMNKEIAAEQEAYYNKELVLFKEKLERESLSGGEYFDDWQWNQIYVKDGKEISVLTGLWKNVSSTEDDFFKTEIKYDEERGVWTSVSVDKRTNNMRVSTRGVWESSKNYISTIWSGKITSYGGSHDWWKWLDIDGGTWDPIYSPKGGKILKVEDFGKNTFWKSVVVEFDDGKIARFSHLDEFNWLEVWDYSDKNIIFEKGAILGTMWNTWYVIPWPEWDGSHLDLQIQGMNAYQIEEYLNTPDIKERDIDFNPIFKVEFKQYNNQELTKSDWDAISDSFWWDRAEFNRQATSYWQKLALDALPTLDDYIEDLKYLQDRFWDKTIMESLKSPSWGSTADKLTAWLWFWDAWAVLKNVVNKVAFQELLDLKANGATFGALTEKEYANIWASTEIGKLKTTASPELWEEALWRLISYAENAKSKIKWWNPYVEQIGSNSSDDEILNFLSK